MDMFVVMSDIFQKISISIPAPGTCGVYSVAGLPTSDFFLSFFYLYPLFINMERTRRLKKMDNWIHKRAGAHGPYQLRWSTRVRCCDMKHLETIQSHKKSLQHWSIDILLNPLHCCQQWNVTWVHVFKCVLYTFLVFVLNLSFFFSCHVIIHLIEIVLFYTTTIIWHCSQLLLYKLRFFEFYFANKPCKELIEYCLVIN